MLINLYEALQLNFDASEEEILVALARYIYNNPDSANPQVIEDTKRYLLNSSIRTMYDNQLKEEFPEIADQKYPETNIGVMFNIQDKEQMLLSLNKSILELKQTDEVLSHRIEQMRGEEKIYRFPTRNREYLDVDFNSLSRNFVSDGAKTAYLSLLQIFAKNGLPVRHLFYTENNQFSYIRYYEYTVLKFKATGRKKYFLVMATPEELAAKGIEHVEPATASDGSLFNSRLLIDKKNPAYLEEAAIDHIIEESQAMYDHAIESIKTFNETVVNHKRRKMEEVMAERAVKTPVISNAEDVWDAVRNLNLENDDSNDKE